jgi:hypothetical protein
MRLSEKLGALCAAAAVLPLIVASILLFYWLSSHISDSAIENLQRDSRAAAGMQRKRLAELLSVAQRISEEIANRALVSEGDRDNSAAWARLQDLLPGAQNEHSLDFVIVSDAQGRVIARHNDRPATSESLLSPENKNPIVEKVIADGLQARSSPTAAPVIESGARLDQLGLRNVSQVTTEEGTSLEEALTLEAAAPIFSAKRFIGVVVIGQVLNNYYRPRPGPSALQVPLVTEVQQTLYPDPEMAAGALISLRDIVVASSVPAEGAGGEPLLRGVKCQPGKNEEALSSGDASYTVSWQGIKSLAGEQIGAIGIAVQTSRLRSPISTLQTLLFSIAAVACLVAGAGGYFFGRSLGSRVGFLSEAASRMSLGELSTPVRDPSATEANGARSFLKRDEITELAGLLDQARESFRLAVERLRKR